MCVCESLGSSSMLRLIRRDVTLVRMFPTFDSSDLDPWSRNLCGRNGTGPGCVTHDQLLKLQKIGRFGAGR